MKTIILNAGPRKNWNTAQLLQSAAKGAESAGSEVEYVDLYELNFTGCRSCLACKTNTAKPRHCYYKDDLSPVIDRIYESDALIVGSPIYLMDTTSQFHALMERLVFTNLSYGIPHPFTGKINFGGIFTMNATENWYYGTIEPRLKDQLQWLKGLNGAIRILPCMDTLQVHDYSKYDMGAFDAEHKKQVHLTQFPKDIEAAFQMGAELSR
ncbi:MAG: flavodoxin family protein [Butyrivibrio sp.]|nr:flavodoxin family protein [Ruminococcus flavefaciens]MCM1561566.1 flavodoxin family protein [Butyrivibrio sp.]